LSTLQYLDKRDSRGVILRCSAHELAYDASLKALDLICDSIVYQKLIDVIPKQFVDLYYKKMTYEALLPIAHQLVIYRHDIKNYGKTNIDIINANHFPCQALLREIWPEMDYDFSILPLNQIKTWTKDILFNGKKIIKNVFHYSDNDLEQLDLGHVNIAINYQEGFNINKRSDIFWIQDSGVDPKYVTIYYENPYMMTRHDKDKTAQNFFFNAGINQVKLWEWDGSNNKYVYENIIEKLKLFNHSNDIEKWIKKTAIHLCKRSSFWAQFFEYFCINIHLDVTESGLELIFKQIAINHLGGLSVGKLRSYQPNLDGALVTYYPYDVFFPWGIDSARITKSKSPQINNILLSGFPYNSKKPVHDKEIVLFKGIEKTARTKFNILLLDDNHSHNDGLYQFVSTEKMVLLYQSILDWAFEDEQIGLVIKPKKAHFLNSLPNIKKQIHKLEKRTDRCILIDDSFQKMPNNYLDNINIVIGVAVFFPSAVIECVVHGSKAVIYDYPNLRYHEPDLYKWGENKVIFPDLDLMINALKTYKIDPSSQPKLGDWSDKVHELDPFCDQKGGQRIGTYIRWLQDGYKIGHDRDIIIEHANRKYAQSWGQGKVYKTKETELVE